MITQQLRSTLFPYTTLFRSIRTSAIRSTGVFWLECTIPHPATPLRSSRRSIESLRTTSIVCPECRERSEEHTSELQSRRDLVCRLLLEKKNKNQFFTITIIG